MAGHPFRLPAEQSERIRVSPRRTHRRKTKLHCPSLSPPITYLPTWLLLFRILIAGVCILHPLLSQHTQPAFVRRSAALAVLTGLVHSVPPIESSSSFSWLMYSILSHPSSSHIIMSVRMSDSNRTICWCLASSFSFLAVSLSGIITPPLISNLFRNKSTLPVWVESALAVVYPSESGRMIGSSADHPPSFRNTFVNVCPINFEAHSVPLSRIPRSMTSGYLSARITRAGSLPVSSADTSHSESFLLTSHLRWFRQRHPCNCINKSIFI